MASDNQLKEWIGKPQFKRRVTYAYSPHTNSFTFFTPDRGRHMVPIGVFSPIQRTDITYDVEAMVEDIAEHMSLFANHEYFDIESDADD